MAYVSQAGYLMFSLTQDDYGATTCEATRHHGCGNKELLVQTTTHTAQGVINQEVKALGILLGPFSMIA